MSEQHDDVLTCSECHSDQPDRYAIAQFKMGFQQPPCKYCGGVTILVKKIGKDQALKQADRQRGITPGLSNADPDTPNE